jgi:hypothetical protein
MPPATSAMPLTDIVFPANFVLDCNPNLPIIPHRLTRILIAPSVMRWPHQLLSVFVAFLLATAVVRAAEEDDVFFEKKIRPLLVQHCFECHSEDAQESGLRVDSLAAILRGGERGTAIVKGKPNESLLISAVRHGELLKMPPKRKLSIREVADLEQWVARGAPWPGEIPVTDSVASDSKNAATFSDKQLRHWAFQKTAVVPVPSIQNSAWVQSPIDAFILQTLISRGLTPAPQADKTTLIRRASIDLLGLPPSPEEVDAFLADDSSDAWPRLIDRLLASPRYGERWGRHWLDVARYADSNGLDENLAYANAFRYRDYVVNAWNRDLPYDQFTREQLAGDLLTLSGDSQIDLDRIIATGFLSLGAKMLAEDDPVKMQMDIIDEQVDTVGRAFLGMTLGCARCHDHKYDPFTLADYYGLAGIFASTKTMETHTVVAKWLERPLGTPDAVAARDQQQGKIASVDSRLRESIDSETKRLLRTARLHTGDYWLAAQHAERLESLLKNREPVGSRPDAATQPGVILIEAEKYVRGNVLQDTTSYGVGIGVLVNRGETPNFAEYDIAAPADGLYQIEVRYAAASARPTKLLINGQLVKSDIARDVTGGWQPENQVWKIEGFFPLKSGGNVIRIEQPQFFPHIDKLLLAPASSEVVESSRFRLDRSHELLPTLVNQWHKFLQSNRENQLLQEWDSLAAKPPDGNSLHVAEQIQRDAVRIVEVWERALELNKDASSLDNPQDEAIRRVLYEPAGPFATPKDIEGDFAQEIRAGLEKLRQEKSALEAALPKLPEAMAVVDDAPRDLRIHIRGSHLTLGAVAPRHFPTVFKDDHPIEAAHSGRLELANWIANGEHPLTARVMVNRIWQWHFGAGLVRTSDNFGLLGDRPTHPELLDSLAQRIVESGWSVKSLHRMILLSSTYRMSTLWNDRAAELDPDNTLLWRFNRKRLEAETLRDSLLFVSDQLDARMGGSQLPTGNRLYVTSTASVDPVVYESRRRSVYLPVVRSALFDYFQAFDFADPSVSQGKRETTTIAPQALFLMNSKFVSEQTRALAMMLLVDSSRADAERVQDLFRKALGRSATALETDRAVRFLSEYSHRESERSAESSDSRLRAWQSLCRAVVSTNEFIYVE